MNNISLLLEFLKGKRTYAVASAAALYLVTCDFTGKPVNEKVIGILGSIGLATLRAGIKTETKK